VPPVVNPPTTTTTPPISVKPPTKTTTTTASSDIPSYSPNAGPGHIPNAIVESLLKTYENNQKFESPLAHLMSLAATQEKQSENMIDPRLAAILQSKASTQDVPATSPSANYYKYGTESPSVADQLNVAQDQKLKEGGAPDPHYGKGGLPVVKGRKDFRDGAHVAGPGDGTSDDIPAMLADGEFVFPADVVAALGNGSSKAGTQKLYEMMHSIRARQRSAKPHELPPDALKSPLDYLKGRKK